MNKPILYVGHDAFRAGAQMELLHFLRWFAKNGKRSFSVLLGAGGGLLPEYCNVGHTSIVEDCRWRSSAPRAMLARAAGLGRFATRMMLGEVQSFGAQVSPALVYMNSVASARLVDLVAPSVPILTHVHELEVACRAQPISSLARLFSRSRVVIACSEAVRANVVANHGMPADRVVTIHEAIAIDETEPQRDQCIVFDELRIPHGASILAGGGANIWRKGGDIFVRLAHAVVRQRRDVFFLWFGGVGSDLEQMSHDAKRLGIADNMRLLGAVPKPADYIGASNVFALTSREDPYPLVCLEAAALGKPIVCFADAGGMPEFVESDCGFVVPYLDVAGMADRVLGLLASPECRAKMGAAAKRKVIERHDIGVAAPRILELIERTIASG